MLSPRGAAAVAAPPCPLPGELHACAPAAWRTVLLLLDKVGALAGEAELGFESKGLRIKCTFVWTKDCEKITS